MELSRLKIFCLLIVLLTDLPTTKTYIKVNDSTLFQFKVPQFFRLNTHNLHTTNKYSDLLYNSSVNLYIFTLSPLNSPDLYL